MPASYNPSKFAKAAKFVVALVGGVLSVLSMTALPDPYDKYVASAVALLTALGVYQVRNAPTSAPYNLDSQVNWPETAPSSTESPEQGSAGASGTPN